MPRSPAESSKPLPELARTPAPPPPAGRHAPWIRLLGALLALTFFGVALTLLHRELAGYRYHDVTRYLASLPRTRVALAVALTAFSYLMLSGYDILALRYLGRRLRYRVLAMVSFVSYALSHNLGMVALSGAPVRYRFYSTEGFSAIEVAKIVAFCSLTFWMGFAALAGAVFVIEPLPIPAVLHLHGGSTVPIGLFLLTIAGSYLLACSLVRRPLEWRGLHFALPSPVLAAGQLVVSVSDWALSGTVLYALMPEAPGFGYAHFLSIYLLATITGLASQVPAGLGVFETMVLLLLPAELSHASALGALLAFRGIYYLLPLTAAAVMLAAREALRLRDRIGRTAARLERWAAPVVPTAMGFMTFLGGAILLFSGATPAEPSRLAWIKDVLPLGVLEVSHFLGSVAGVGLLFLGRGLQRRLDAAYHLTVILLTAGIVVSLLKGLDYEEAAVLTLTLAALLPCRKLFYRRASLTGEPFTFGWSVAIAVVVGGSIWLGLFSYKHVDYSQELWWHFTFQGDAPRFMRATVGVVVVATVIGIAVLLRSSRPVSSLPAKAALARAAGIVERSPSCGVRAALLGDKRFLFNDDATAFVMYGIEGRSWIALGDPVGPPEQRVELTWQFSNLADRYDAWTVFYQVPQDSVPIYIDLGLTLLKLGEAAYVPLRDFSLDGHARKELRHARRRIEGEGCSFEVVGPPRVPALLPELRRISDDWLATKKAREKGFSLGRFDEVYLARFPHALVHLDGRIVAFANLWTGADAIELSVDLMRYASSSPSGVMDYLLIESMLWGRRQGFRRFDLGMAPLAGLEDHPQAPLWNRFARFVYRHGEEFYNFQGLRRYKEKFDPLWEPRYLASPGGMVLPRILTNLATLISGGVRGVFRK